MTSYDVVALEMPIVYTLEGDHDPDGLMFAPKAHRPLLEWIREQWEHGGRLLPRLHLRRQRVQILVDGLARLERQLERLYRSRDEEHDLLAELLRRESAPEYGQPEERPSHGPRSGSPRSAAIRQNIETTLTEVRAALADLGDTAARPDDAAVGDLRDAAASDWHPEPALVSLSPARRADRRRTWLAQLALLDEAIRDWFADFEDDPGRRFDADRLAQRVLDETGVTLPPGRIAQLLLNDHTRPVAGLGIDAPPYDRFNPMRPVPLVEPLVLRTRVAEPLEVHLHNSVRGRRVGFHVQGDGLGGDGGAGVGPGDGCHAGDNPDSTCGPGQTRTFAFAARHEGVWPVNDLADVRGSEQGTNVHGLFGAVVVEPPNTTWHDPVSGEDLTDAPYGVGLYVDVHAAGEPLGSEQHRDFVDFHHDDVPRSFREFTVFMHDEPEVHSALHAGEHTVMPLSYRAEPMGNRLPHRMRRYAEATPARVPVGRTEVDRRAVEIRIGDELEEQFWTARTPEGHYLERVAGEEQHHSSWLFGDPVTPLLRAYRGDPYRIRLVHAGVKETHVFHLHVHQWRAVAADTAEPGAQGLDEHGVARPHGSQLLDSITIGPQTGFTIDPQYGAGSRQHAFGDVIWHCHLYPHFHHGMWGLLRSYDTLVDGRRAYPDGSPCPPLEPLPGRVPEPPASSTHGFPWFIDGQFPMKSPPPPAASGERRYGRRRLLRMPAHTPAEYAAMAPACRTGDTPGALFVDLDGLAEQWNARAGLPAPRIVSYDVEVSASDVAYNADGWHDPRGHHYRLLRAQVRERTPEGDWRAVRTESFELDPDANPEPVFPRANHGDVVEWRMHNALTSFAADDFDLGQAPVECGLHVHLVKFDVLAADGSSTGWNYLSGASCREAVGADAPGELSRVVGLHRWVVDEEFGPCFFHDHLLANYRQKHGLFSALVAEPHGSLWQRPEDPSRSAWSEPQAVIVPPDESGLPPYRDACLAIGDFVPLLDEGDRPLNPPSVLSGDDDPGSMGVNYRCAPLTHRGADPSLWFSTAARSSPNLAGVPGEPDTPLVLAYSGERVRIRLIQGSHEEQHSFNAHGLRWRHDWGNPASPLVNQQSLGISEAFTLDLGNEATGTLGVGDHLWHFGTMDDLWTGCWGYLRVLRADAQSLSSFPALPELRRTPAEALTRLRTTRAVPGLPQRLPDGRYDPDRVRTFVVVARRHEHHYAGPHLTDPWGLQWHLADLLAEEYEVARSTGTWRPAVVHRADGPLVLRARRGQWVRVFVINEVLTDDPVLERILPRFGVEPAPPRLPLEHLDAFGHPDRRTVSPRVALHPSLLCYDVTAYDGAYVGRNHDGTVAALDVSEGPHGAHDEEGDTVVHREHGGAHHDEQNWAEHWWYCDERLAPASTADGPGTVCYLQDMGDIRNHRHHGLVGALVVEPGDVTAYRPGSSSPVPDGESGREAELRAADGTVVAREAVVFFHDGLRLFVNGHRDMPVRDVVPGDDAEDSGQRALNLRTALVHHGTPPRGAEADPPLLQAAPGDTVWLRVVAAMDKPRQHTLTVHGLAWEAAPWVPGGEWVGGVSGVAPGWARTLVLRVENSGDHVIRTGAFRWGTELGVWGLLRVRA